MIETTFNWNNTYNKKEILQLWICPNFVSFFSQNHSNLYKKVFPLNLFLISTRRVQGWGHGIMLLKYTTKDNVKRMQKQCKKIAFLSFLFDTKFVAKM